MHAARTMSHVRANVFPFMPALHVAWHMCRHLAQLLFGDGDRERARAKRTTPTRAPASARHKAERRTASNRRPVRSVRSLLEGSATLTLNGVTLQQRSGQLQWFWRTDAASEEGT